jgi:HEPN domain-containing protein
MKPPEKKSERKKRESTPAEWMRHARSDLEYARMGFANPEILPEQICFHAQQAVEKSLKALLLHYRIDFHLTHDIQELVEGLKRSGIALPPFMENAINLTPYAVVTRYPGHLADMSQTDIQESISIAEKIVGWIGETLKIKG